MSCGLVLSSVSSAKYFFLLGDGLIGRCSCLDVMAPREDVLAPLEDVMALGVDVMALGVNMMAPWVDVMAI